MAYIFFAHANGFPAKTYKILFKFLKKYNISTVDTLATNIRSEDINWDKLSDEIIYNVPKTNNRIYGVGHSLGGVLTLLAASKCPDMFHSVILLDPPLFSFYKRNIIRILRLLKLDDIFSPASKSLKRRDNFNSKKEAFEYFKTKKLFKNFDPIALQDYVNYGLVENGNGFELKIPVNKEIAIYRKLLTEYPRKMYQVKGVLAYGSRKPILWKSDLNWIKNNFKKIKIYPFPGNHFFPLENPESTAMFIERHIKYNI